MNKKDIMSTSTPTNRLVQKRKSIHEHENDLSTVSPITRSPKNDNKYSASSHESSDQDTDSDQEEYQKGQISSETSKSHYNSSILKQKESICGWKSVIAIFVILPSLLAALYFAGADSNENNFDVNLSMLKSRFPTQDLDIWNIIESGITEVKNFNKPSIFLFLYKSEAEQTLNLFLKNISVYTSCALTKCDYNPLILSSEQLITNEAKNDYGYIIHKYRNTLKEKGVMVVKNLEKIPGSIARAFHTFCDEFTPLVKNSVIIFTMNVDHFPQQKNEMDYVENILRDKWQDIEEDELSPLLTRVLSMVLKILPENNVAR